MSLRSHIEDLLLSRQAHIDSIAAIDLELLEARQVLEGNQTAPAIPDNPLRRRQAELAKMEPESPSTSARDFQQVTADTSENAPENADSAVDAPPAVRAHRGPMAPMLTRQAVFDVIAKHQPVTKAFLAKHLDRRESVVYQHVYQLLQRREVVKHSQGPNGPDLYTLPNAPQPASSDADAVDSDPPEPQPPLRSKDVIAAHPEIPKRERRCSRCARKFESAGDPYCPTCTPVVEAERRQRVHHMAHSTPGAASHLQ